MNLTGVVEAIHVAGLARAPMVERARVRLLAGKGVAGDRYADGCGTFSDWPKDHELTLIESETIDAVRDEYGIDLSDGLSRRSLTTRGVALNDLVGRRFRVGAVLCEGTRRCDPCAHLEVATGIGGLARVLANRGGLRARILQDGEVSVGDAIVAEMITSLLPGPEGSV